MRSDSLSEQDRLRLAQLIKAPLIPPTKPPKKQVNRQEPKDAWDAVAKNIRNRWNGWSVPATKYHLAAHWREWAVGGAVSLGCLILLTITVRLAGQRDDDPVKLQVREHQGQLQIRWDADSDLIRRATGAKLFITDGAERLFVTLDGERLRQGRVSYARQSGRVEVRMALTQPDGRTVEQQATFFGAPSPDAEESQLAASAQPPAPPAELQSNAAEARSASPAGMTAHRARRKPLMQSGTNLPFTCTTGDVFRKTDAPPGWDTFTCRGKNVWGVSRTQTGEDRSAQRPNTNATTLTAKPASASTT